MTRIPHIYWVILTSFIHRVTNHFLPQREYHEVISVENVNEIAMNEYQAICKISQSNQCSTRKYRNITKKGNDFSPSKYKNAFHPDLIYNTHIIIKVIPNHL